MHNLFTSIFLASLFIFLTVQLILMYRQNRFMQAVSQESTKAKAYMRAKLYYAASEVIYNTVLMIAWTFAGGINLLYHLVSMLKFNDFRLFFTMLMLTVLVIYLLKLPLLWFKHFLIEKSFGFNRMPARLFFIDFVKRLLFQLVIMAPLVLSVLLAFYKFGQDSWWLISLILLTSQVLLIYLHRFIFRLFTPLRLLTEVNLTEQIQQLLKQIGFMQSNIYSAKSSNQTSHSNAGIIGLGKNKAIILSDTLLKDLNSDEILAVVAHELGHFKLKHQLIYLLCSAIVILLSIYCAATLLNIPEFFQGFYIANPSFVTLMALIMVLYPLLSFIIQPLRCLLLRQFEYTADQFAIRYLDKNHLKSALLKLAHLNAMLKSADNYYSCFYDTHPTLSQRINKLS